VKHFCLAVTVLCGLAFSGYAAADAAGQTQTPSPAPYEPQEYSPPLGGEGCSTPTPIS